VTQHFLLGVIGFAVWHIRTKLQKMLLRLLPQAHLLLQFACQFLVCAGKFDGHLRYAVGSQTPGVNTVSSVTGGEGL
jgi:hypothetical protein